MVFERIYFADIQKICIW